MATRIRFTSTANAEQIVFQQRSRVTSVAFLAASVRVTVWTTSMESSGRAIGSRLNKLGLARASDREIYRRS